jgi:hypothetical protein
MSEERNPVRNNSVQMSVFCQFEGALARWGMPTPLFGTGTKTSLKAVRRISSQPASVPFKAYVTRH